VQPGNPGVALVVHHIGQHQRKEAHEEAQEDGDHHDGQSVVFARLSRARGGHVGSAGGGAFSRSTRTDLEVVVVADFLLLVQHRDVDAGVRDDYDQAGQQEADHEQRFLDRSSLLLEYCAGEGGFVQTHLAPDAQNGR